MIDKNLYQTSDFKNIVINDIPLIDVRAPIEYEKGAFPNSINIPILNNEERHIIGICYKESSDVICDTDEYDIILDMKIVG